MKNYSKITVFLFLLLLFLGRGDFVLAQNAKQFCDKLPKAYADLQKNIENQKIKVEEKFKKINPNISLARISADKKLKTLRAQEDVKLDKYFKQLDGFAKTETQKKAVNNYKQTVTLAREKFRVKVDEINSGYQKKLDNLQLAYIAQADKNFKNYGVALEKMLQTASSSCLDLRSAQVNLQLKKDLKEVKSKYLIETKSAKIQVLAKNLSLERTVAINKADAEYRQTVSLARSDLTKIIGSKFK